MKVSRTWLQKYVAAELPTSEEIAEMLTFHAAEIEEVDGDLIEVNVLPDRASYLLSHRGVASEVAASLGYTLSHDPLREPVTKYGSYEGLSVDIEGTDGCARYIGAVVRGVTVGPSPDWLRAALASVGQRSINNVVDATNYVMLDIGQPLHAFDAGKLTAQDGRYAIKVRGALEGERTTTLTGEEYVVPEDTLLIVDKHADHAIGIAGVKGGKAAAIDDATTDIVIESANFDSTQVRKAAQALKLFTDASSRFQNKPSPLLAAYGMQAVLALIQEVAGGTVAGVTEVAQESEAASPVTVTLAAINGRLGASYSAHDVRGAFDALAFTYTEHDGTFTVTPPFERNDIRIPEDLVEEAGRILGYDRIPSVELPLQHVAADQARYRGIERIKDFLLERGYSELSTQSFAAAGDIELANPLDKTRPYLRASLVQNMEERLRFNAGNAPRVLGPTDAVKLFEIGTIFRRDGERLMLALGVQSEQKKLAPKLLRDDAIAIAEILEMPCAPAEGALMFEFDLTESNLEKLGEEYAPTSVTLGTYRPFSVYPFALRDVAVWTPAGTEESEVLSHIVAAAGEYLARIDRFDRFEKDGRISYAFRLVFESMERTLSDADLDPAMERVTQTLSAVEGYEVR